MPLFHHILMLLGFLPAMLMGLAACDECAESYKACDPDGASLRDVPIPGPDLGRLYLEMLYTVKSAPAEEPEARVLTSGNRDGKTLCCAETTQCLLTQSFHIAMCWDKFTTDYFLPDGSYGALSNGSYTSPSGDTANLISGEYKLATGETGNFYDLSPADKPYTSELPMPTPWTSQGVGTAIPGSELGATSAAAEPTSSSTASSVITSTTSSVITLTASRSSEATKSYAPYGTYTLSEVATTSWGGRYGEPVGNSTTVNPAATGTNGASTITSFTSSPTTPPFISVAATSFICYLAPGLLFSALAAILLG